MDPVRYIARVKAENTRVELRVNDIPVAIFTPGAARAGAEVPLNEFLVAGSNTVKAIANANPLPSRALDAWAPGADAAVNLGAPAEMQVTITREGGGSASAGFAPVALAWNSPAQPVPVAVDRRFDVDTRFPAWAWTRAQEMQPSDGAAAYQALRALHARLVQRDAGGIAAVMDLKLREVTAGAYGVPPEPLRNGLLKGLGQCMADPTWNLLAVEPGQVDLRLVGNRRLAECLRPGGSHALMYAKAGSAATFFLPVMLGLLEGRWQVLR